MNFDKLKTSFARFFAAAKGIATAPLVIFENASEEIAEAMGTGRDIKVYGATPAGRMRGNLMALGKYAPRGSARDEKNYLFSTRRFPAAVDNVNPGAIAAAEYPFFNQALNNNGASMGYPTGYTLSQADTNLDVPSQIPNGKGFVLEQEGISFNAEAASGDIEQVLDCGALAYQTQGGQFELRKGPGIFWPGGHGVSGFGNMNGAESAHNGLADPRAVRNLGRLPRVIKPLQQFNYVYRVSNAGLRPTDGTPWNLSKFLQMRLWLWGEQVDKIPE